MSTQVKEKSAGKHASFVEAQLARAEGRIRLVDQSAALLGLLAGTLAYAVLMILLDRFFALSGATRQVGFLLYVVAAALYLAIAVVRPLLWRVNPYFAARQIEQTLPGSRNHVVNWIDLRDEKLPAVIKNTLGQRAARDLSRTDVDRAIASTRALVAGGAAALFAVLFIALFLILGPNPFGSFLARAFTPFGNTAVATRTQVTIVRPENGDAAVTIGNPVTIVARVEGRIPDARAKDAPCLLYRHDPSEPYRQRYLQRDDTGNDWGATVAPRDVGNGFWYRVTAGDATTPEYHVKVRTAPLIADFLATYRYRPYVGKANRIRTSRRLEDLRGSEVTLLARTTRTVKEGRLDFESAVGGGQAIPGERVPGEPQSLRFRLVLDQPGRYRIRFTSTEGEPYVDATAHDVVVLPDHPPRVRITAPAKDVTLPADGHLKIAGEASDDYGIARLALCLEIAGGKQKLKSLPYEAHRLGKPGYGTPRHLPYQDLLDLPKLVDEQGKRAELKPGTVVEYWLEAADACDFPAANVTLSTPRYKITIAEGKENEQQKKDRGAAQQQKKKDEQQRGEDMQKEQADRDQKRKEEEKRNDADTRAREKEREDAKKGGNPDDQQNESKGDDKQGQASNGAPKQNERDKQTEQTANDLKNALDKDGKGEGSAAGKKDEGKDGKSPDSKSDDGKDGKEKDKSGKGSGTPRDKGGPEKGRRPPDKEANPNDLKEDKDKGGKGKPGKEEDPTAKDDPNKAEKGDGSKGSKGKEGPKKDNQPDKGKNDPDKKKQPRPEDARPSDVERAAKDLKSKDPQKREKATSDLQGMQEKAKDPQTREAARKALEQAKKDGQPGKEGPGGKGDEGPKKDGKGDSPGKGKGKKDGDEKKGEGNSGGSGKPKDKQKNAGGDPGEGADRRESSGSGGQPSPPKRKGEKPDRHRASMMQLEEFKKKVDKGILEKMKMSKEQFEKFLRDYADLARRQAKEKDDPELLPAPAGATLPGMGARPVRRPGGKPGDLRNEGTPKPPPGYGEAYSELLKKLGESR
jgi:hypothetical protein